jgi:hypothetical protein
VVGLGENFGVVFSQAADLLVAAVVVEANRLHSGLCPRSVL